ncbi:MAG: acyltransferase [Hyphomicrobiales bacterium]|nr:acyltransferase [Hyphomicrobiales bacterium]
MQERISALDTLRGTAILAVMAGHYLPENLLAGAVAWHVTSLGRGGVILFFLLSGYLIYWNVERQTTAIFLSRRAFKILPAYLVSVLALFILGYFFEPRWPALTLLSNLTMTQDVFGQPMLTGVYWTLLIEVKFYIFIAAQYFLFRDKGTLLVPLAAIVVNVYILLARGYASQLLTFLPAFYVGIQVRRWQRDKGSSPDRLLVTALAVAASLIFFDQYYGWWSCLYLLAATAALIYAVRGSFSNAMLCFFGRISYSDYLYHAAIGSLIISAFATSTGWPVGLLAVAAAFSVSTLVAILSYRWVEVPFVELGKSRERASFSPQKEVA